MRAPHLTPIVAAALLQGCAYLTTYKADLGNPDVGVSIDAKQRVVLMAPVETKKEEVIEEAIEVQAPKERSNKTTGTAPSTPGDSAKAATTTHQAPKEQDNKTTSIAPGTPGDNAKANTTGNQEAPTFRNTKRTTTTTTTKQRRTCAEPSPDALAAISASVGGSFITDPASSKQLAAALGESASNIGLRTTSIQLMRDAMYRVCEAYLSGGIDQEQYADLQAHSQSLIVGLLAIEQLTSAVVARQGSITTSAAAGGLPEVSDSADALSKAKKKTADQKVVLDKAAAARGAAEDAVKAKKAALDAIDASETDKVATAERELKEVTEKVQPLKEAESAADAQLAVFKLAEETAQKVFDVARSRIDAKVSGTASFVDGEKRGASAETSKENAAVIAPSVALIVTSVMQQSVIAQKCLNLMSKPLGPLREAQVTVLTAHCARVANGELTREVQTGLVTQIGEAIHAIGRQVIAEGEVPPKAETPAPAAAAPAQGKAAAPAQGKAAAPAPAAPPPLNQAAAPSAVQPYPQPSTNTLIDLDKLRLQVEKAYSK